MLLYTLERRSFFFVCSCVPQIFVRKLVSQVLKEGLPEATCLNVNIPKLSSKDIKGVRICRQANANWSEEFEERKDLSGKTYYWPKGTFQNHDNEDDTDEWALANGYVSIVPIQYDVTAYNIIPKLKDLEL